MATRIVKQETIIKNKMQSFVDQNGFEKEISITEEGNFFYIMPPNRFGSGYIRLNLSTGEKWAANFSEKTPGKVCAPKRQAHLENFFSRGA